MATTINVSHDGVHLADIESVSGQFNIDTTTSTLYKFDNGTPWGMSGDGWRFYSQNSSTGYLIDSAIRGFPVVLHNTTMLTTQTEVTFRDNVELYAFYLDNSLNTFSLGFSTDLDGHEFQNVIEVLVNGTGPTINSQSFLHMSTTQDAEGNPNNTGWAHPILCRKRIFQKGTTVSFDLVKTQFSRLFLVFTPFTGTAISIDGIHVANIDTRMTESSDILPEEFQGYPTYSYTGSETNNFLVEVIEDVDVYVFTPASVDLTSLGFETYTSTTTDSVWKKEFKKGTSEILDMTDGVILVFKPSITELTTTNANIQNNQWNYLSFTFDKSAKTCKVFINETEVARADNINTDIIGTDFTNIKIGEGFEGCVDEVGIYNAALPPAMIASLKNNESYIDDFLKSGVVGNWDFSLMSSNADNGVFYADNNILANPATASGVVERGSLSGHRSVKFDPDNATTGYLTVSNSGIDASNLSVALWVNPSSNDQTIVKKNNVFEVRIDSNRNPRMEIGDNTIPVNMTTVDVGVADTTLVGHFKFYGDLSNNVVDGTEALYPLGPLVFGDDKFIQLDGSNYVDIGTNIIPADTSNLSMSMWVDISSLPENGKLPLISVATGMNESLEWSLTRVGDSVKTDLEFINIPVVRDFLLSDSAEIHSIALPGYGGLLWPDGTVIGGNITGAEVVLTAPHTLANVVGNVRQVISLENYVISLDTKNKLYVMVMYSANLLSYNFMVDKNATTFPAWVGGGNQTKKIFYEAEHLQSILTPIYGNTAIRAIHRAGNDIFFIEYEDKNIHVVQVMSYQTFSMSQRYYSPTNAQTITGLVGDWDLSNVIPGILSAYIFMKRTGATAPYKAFKTETTQYGKDDVTEENNVRVFTFGNYRSVDTGNYSGGVIRTDREITSDWYDSLYSGVLKSSTQTTAWSNSKYTSGGSSISYQGTPSMLQYWFTFHLKYILEEGFLPTRTIQLGYTVLVLFENEDGAKEWHLINNNIQLTAESAFDQQKKWTAQYLLNNTMYGFAGSQHQYSTILYRAARAEMKGSAEFVRLQSVMAAFEDKAADGNFDDLVFVIKTRGDSGTQNSTQLQAYVKSMNTTFTLGQGVDVNLVEVTTSVLTADTYNYIDHKGVSGYGLWGGYGRVHNWLFANNQFEAVPLKALYLQTWGMVVVRDV